MKVLVLGDYIDDFYEFYTATRLCPEAPCPVLVRTSPGGRLTAGGAGLVANQLNALEKESASCLVGSVSNKTRIFADDRLMLRIDDDSFDVNEPETYIKKIEHTLESKYDAIIVSDYGKGAFTHQIAEWLVRRADDFNIPVFVDAKNTFEWYAGAFAAFPNEKETAVFADFKHVIQKLGPNGACVDAVHIPTNSHPVRDTTGAGDTFIAAFVYKFLKEKEWAVQSASFNPNVVDEQTMLQRSAAYANMVAGISVEFVGTHVVTKEEIDAHN